MAATRLASARARVRGGALLAVAAIVLLVSGAATGIVGTLGASIDDGVRTGFAQHSAQERGIRWEIRRSPEPDRQQAAAGSVLDAALDPVGLDWRAALRSAPLDLEGGADGLRLVVAADPALPGRARLVAGEWPGERRDADGALPAAVHAGALDALGLEVGDVVTAGEAGKQDRIRIAGAWRPASLADPGWFGDPHIATGVAGGTAGPFLVAEGALDGFPGSLYASWTTIADPEQVRPEALADMQAAISGIEAALRADRDVGTDGIAVTGTLPETLAALASGAAAVAALTPLPVAVVGLAGLVALQRLAALIVGARREETLLLRARGAGPARFAGLGAAEALVVAVPTAALGAAAGAAFLAGFGVDPGILAPVGIGAVWVLAAVLLLAGAAWIDARRPVVRSAAETSGRVRRGIGAGAAILLAAAATLALQQFLRAGSPLVVRADGVRAVDPVAAAAPVLLLAVAAVAAVLALPRLAGALERAADRRRGLLPALPLAEFARRGPLFRTAAMLAVLAVGAATMTAGLAGTWARLDERASSIAAGGDVRVAFLDRAGAYAEPGGPPADPLAGLDGADAASGTDALVTEARIGSLPADFVAVDGARLPASADAGRVPLVFTRELAAAVDARVGSPVELRIAAGGGGLSGVVADIVDTVPRSGGAGVLANLAEIEAALADAGERVPLPNERWIASTDPEALAARISADQRSPVVATSRTALSSAAFAAPAIGALGVAAATALALALVGLVALAATLQCTRRDEIVVLRALGVDARSQGRSRALELGVAIGSAVVLGVAAGLLAAALTAPGLARAAVPAAPGSLDAGLALTWAPWTVGLLAFLVAGTAVAGAAARATARDAARPGLREEQR